MLIFIIKRSELHPHTHELFEDVYTIDADVPELELALQRGGFGEDGYERHTLLGAQILGNIRKD
jgi:hypothetical protein